MNDYEEFLNVLNVEGLKKIFRSIKNKRYISITNKTKQQLINDLLKHTTLKDDKIIGKEENIKDMKKDKIKFNNKKTSKLAGEMGKNRGNIDKLEEELNHEKYEDTYFLRGREGMHPRKNKDKDLINDLELKLKHAKESLKNAVKEYKKHKMNTENEFKK